jgi:type IV pilus assembly protein PilC
VQLPLATKIIVAVSGFMVAHSLIVLGALILVLVGGVVFVRSRFGANCVLHIAYHLPVIGELVCETYSARAARSLSSLLSSGVDVLTALSITREIIGAELFASAFAEAEERVRKGEPLSLAFANRPKLYPILFSEMIMVGEETGGVAQMLGQVAEYYETDVEERTKDLSTIIEPILILMIGAGVGGFAISMISPIYSITSKI